MYDAEFIEYEEMRDDSEPIAWFRIMHPVSKYYRKKVSLEFLQSHGMPIPEHQTFKEWKENQ